VGKSESECHQIILDCAAVRELTEAAVAITERSKKLQSDRHHQQFFLRVGRHLRDYGYKALSLSLSLSLSVLTAIFQVNLG